MGRTYRLLTFVWAVMAVAAPVRPDPADTIVVTARSLSKIDAELAACRARGCPADEDMRLSLEAAEARFVAGSYRDARATLENSLRRHPGAAKQHPNLVASLHRASARISQHYGDRDRFQRSTYEISRSLREAYPEDSPQVFFARLEAADMLVRSGDMRRALRAYESLASQSARLGSPRALMVVELRLAWMEMLAGRAKAGEARLARLTQASNDPLVALTADVVRMRAARAKGNEAEADRLAASIVARSAQSSTRPRLLVAPKVELGQTPAPMIAAPDDRVVTNGGPNGSISSPEHTWIDVGFWVTPDGRVSEAEVLRAAKDRDRWWHARVLDAVGRRQYSAYASTDGQPGVYRIERFTLNSWLSSRQGSRIGMRDGRLKVESVDLTPETAAPPT